MTACGCRSPLAEFIETATEQYGLRIFDNIDLDKLDESSLKARVVAKSDSVS